MNSYEIISLLVTAVGVISFSAIFTVLYRNYANSAVAEYESGKCDVELIDETIISNAKEAKSYRRVFKRIKQILVGAVVVILVPFMLMSVYSKLTRGIAMVGGHGIVAVASGSMSEKNSENKYLASLNDQFNTYDVIVVDEVSSDADLQLYDVIAYVNDKGVNIIHRIVGLDYTPEGVRYVTRGDSNNTDDKYRPSSDDVLGEYSGTRIPYIGVFLMFIQSFSGIVTVSAVIYCLIMIESVGNRIYRAREERLLLLGEAIKFESDTVRDEGIGSTFTETVYFKNYAYTFNEKGFVSKTVIEDTSDDGDINSEPDEDRGENSGE